jgi:flagellar biosynthesis protein FlhF
MIIRKFNGTTQTEAHEKARSELGASVVIMNTREVRPSGLLRFFKKKSYEVTAAIEEASPQAAPPKEAKEIPKVIPIELQKEIPKEAHKEIPKKEQTEGQKKETEKEEENKFIEKEHMEVRDAELEERLDNLQQMIEKQLKPEEKSDMEASESVETVPKEPQPIIGMIRQKLIENEVDETFVDEILGEVEQVVQPKSSIDYVLSNVYQKLILQFGQPGGIELGGKKPKVVFFVGPTGVGKTTTIAKIASHYKVEQGRKLALLTSDTYRIAATEQLRIYANILDVPLTIIYTPAEVAQAVDSMSDYDVILVDTSGFSHKSIEQRDSTKMLLDSIGDKYNKEVYLVVSATTKYKDLKEIVDMYAGFTTYKLIFTKLDETSAYGNLLNIRMYSKAEMSYTTNGQVVPDDIEVFNAQKIVKQLLGGRG